MTITIDIFKLTVTLLAVLTFAGMLYVCYKIKKVYKLLQEDRIVNVTIIPSEEGCDIFER